MLLPSPRTSPPPGRFRAVEIHTYTVSELGDRIAAVLDEAFYDGVWVQGEISNLNRSRNGHVYFDLIEPTDETGATAAARLSVALFKANRDVVNRVLKRAGGVRMSDGVQVRISGMLSYYTGNGRLSLRMTGIDPTFTLGQMAARRDQLLRLLAADDLLDRNGRLVLSPVPLRVGLVTSHASAAFADFSRELEQSTFHWRVVLIDSRVQGEGAESEIAAAIRTLGEHDLDVIAVVRGGGSRGDLVVFDSESIARAIAASPVPVMTGIGHETDDSIADRVAHRSLKTPTACAATLIAEVENYLRSVDDAAVNLRAAATRRLDRADARLGENTRRSMHRAHQALHRAELNTGDHAAAVARSADRALHRSWSRLEANRSNLVDAPRRLLRDHERWLDGLSAQVRAHDPVRVMARGWSITRRHDGRLVRGIDDLVPGDGLVTTLVDGDVHSEVTDEPPTSGMEPR